MVSEVLLYIQRSLSSGARVEWTIKMAGVQQRLLILLEPRSRELERIARGLE